MKRNLRIAIGFCAAFAAAGCSSNSEPGLASQLGGKIVPALATEADTALNVGEPTPETSMLIQVAGLGIVGLGVIAEQNQYRTTYVGDAGYSVTFEGDVLVATRGFGKDLMAANVSQVQVALARGEGSAIRQHDYLDSQDQIVTETYECAYEPKGSEEVDLGLRQVEANIISETCQNQRVVFENVYYVDSSGQIIATRQFVSDVVAYLRNNRV